jgi:phage terminase large subunit GpA-like protein
MTISTPISETLFDGAEPFDAFLEDLIRQSAESVQPSEALTVAEAAEKYRWLNNGPAYNGPWRNSKVPYLIEPMEEMTNRLYESVIFTGPAQCGKTELFLNYLTYTVMCDPADITLVQTVQATARDFSITRVDRMHRSTDVVGQRVIVDNTFDKQYRNGMILRLSWPTVNELSGKPIPRMFLTDYDRMTQDVDGEGTPFALAKARITSFKKWGKVIAESSPGFVILDPTWAKRSAHEAPPCSGILSLYNAGDRRRWYWKCINCKHSFEPHWSLLSFPKTVDPIEAGEMAVLNCPHCNHTYKHDYSDFAPSKEEMNAYQAKWVKEGQTWAEDGKIYGTPRRAASASFWLQGVCATFNSWKQLVTDYVSAENEYQETGKEDTLKAVVNTKIGMPYLPKAQAAARIADQIKARAKDYGQRVVPHGVRFLVATIDVQKNRFEVQVHGIGVEDVWVIDRFQIRFSKRPDENDSSQWRPISPGGHPEDWRHVLYEVLMKSYPLADDPDRHMGIYRTFSDSAGGEGFTANAYAFYRWLGRGYSDDDGVSDEVKEMYPWHPGFQARYTLTKGESLPTVPRIRITYPDAQRKDRHANARGEIPVMFINTNALKNHVDNTLERTEPGGRINFPNWLPLSFYKELVVETKNEKGLWENLTGHRNESWDLLVYCYAGLLHPSIHWEHIRWEEPPPFAAEWDANTMVFRIGGDETPFTANNSVMDELAKLGQMMNS